MDEVNIDDLLNDLQNLNTKNEISSSRTKNSSNDFNSFKGNYREEYPRQQLNKCKDMTRLPINSVHETVSTTQKPLSNSGSSNNLSSKSSIKSSTFINSNQDNQDILDELISETEDIIITSFDNIPKENVHSYPNIKGNPPFIPKSNIETKTRCNRIYLGNTSCNRGLRESIISTYVCNNLLCVNCNFSVRCFFNVKWKDEVDYMFFRNNIMNDSKLSSMSVEDKGSCAYCCQCSWMNIKKDLLLGQSGQAKWVCSGHVKESQ